jgi:hypothetical protein
VSKEIHDRSRVALKARVFEHKATSRRQERRGHVRRRPMSRLSRRVRWATPYVRQCRRLSQRPPWWASLEQVPFCSTIHEYAAALTLSKVLSHRAANSASSKLFCLCRTVFTFAFKAAFPATDSCFENFFNETWTSPRARGARSGGAYPLAFRRPCCVADSDYFLPRPCAISRWCWRVGRVLPAQSFSFGSSPPLA